MRYGSSFPVTWLTYVCCSTRPASGTFVGVGAVPVRGAVGASVATADTAVAVRVGEGVKVGAAVGVGVGVDVGVGVGVAVGVAVAVGVGVNVAVGSGVFVGVGVAVGGKVGAEIGSTNTHNPRMTATVAMASPRGSQVAILRCNDYASMPSWRRV
jgi:hypothetical protein